jgi:hypothetical protein
MKQIKKILAITLLTLSGFSQLHATDTVENKNTLPVELQYAGQVKNQPLIQLKFSGSKDENVFSILISDNAGTVLYSGVVTGETFTKQFLLNTDELGDAVLNFEITGKKSGKKAKYKVSNQRQVSQQMDIVKL